MIHREQILPNLIGRRIVAAVTALVAISFILTAGLLIQVTRRLDTSTAEQMSKLADVAIDRQMQLARKEIVGYTYWSEAYQHLHLTTDVNWAFERRNVGPIIYSALGYEYAFVVGPSGTITYEMIDGKLSKMPIEGLFENGLAYLVDRARQVEPGGSVTVSGLVTSHGVPVIAAASAISPAGDPRIALAPGAPSVMVFTHALTPERVDQIGLKGFVDGLQATVRGPADRAGSSLTRFTEDGSVPITFSWTPSRPGHQLLTAILPWLCLAGSGFALLAVLILRRMMDAARTIDSKVQALAQAHRQAEHSAQHDNVTGLPNRLMLHRYLDDALSGPLDGGTATIVYVDLDRFKAVNDVSGHRAGDKVLQVTARRLRFAVRHRGIVARVGGDEFVVALKETVGRSHIDTLCQTLLDVVRRPVRTDGHELRVGLSIGVAMAPSDAKTTDDLMKCADVAMYRAKRDGGDSYRYFGEPLSNSTGALEASADAAFRPVSLHA